MKMTKLLASGTAAAIAVASLASVASAAEEKTFDMGYTVGNYSGSAQFTNKVNETIGASADQKDMKAVYFSVEGTAYAYINPDDADKMGLCIVDQQGNASWSGDYTPDVTAGYDKAIGYVGSWDIGNEWWENGKVVVTGYKYDKDGKKVSVKDNLTLESKCANNLKGNQYFRLVVLKDTEPSHKDTEFAPYYYDAIESVSVTFNYKAANITNESVYTVFNALNGKIKANVGSAFVTDYKFDGDDSNAVEYGSNNNTNKAKLAAEADNKASALIAYLFTNGGWSPSHFGYTEAELTASAEMGVAYDVLKYTETNAGGSAIGDGKLYRNEVLPLSITGDHSSISNSGADGNQSYNNGNMLEGTGPQGFAGFASQVANFFNKQTNGTIKFTFEGPSASTSSSWVIGGIPSTEVGLKDVLDGATLQDFALFFNYKTNGGVMLSAVKVDAASGEVTFDISEYLDACGGLTASTLHDIYYGLTKDASIVYEKGKDDKIGLKVESITLAYDEDSTDTDIEDDTADDDDDVEDDDDTTIDDDADDDDDTTIDDTDDDDDDDDATVDAGEDDSNDNAGDTVIVKPSGDDSNPNTGVALAVVPAAIAAAAVVVSKKRK